mmetsp:Transcript_21770/g.37081  ORF Transcript_21770/g.37081 Transcript_21770/m.37081 type:complete len:883 (-) Transcript_21770:25-2673(-)
MKSPLTNYESDSSSNSNDNNDAAPPPPRSSLPAELIKSPPSSPSATASTTAAAAAEHERQTLLLMLLAQVCSLHDATPRTFVVHVLALFERGILDSNSIRFLFDLGLVPRGYSEQFSGCFDDTTSGESEGGCDECNSNNNHDDESDNNVAQSAAAAAAVSAIVPYAANNPQQHLFMRHLPPPPPIHDSSNNSIKQQTAMATRQSQASAIRRHLAHQESIDSSSARSSVFGSANAGFIPGITSAAAGAGASSTTSSFTANNNSNDNGWTRKNSSSATSKNTLLSVDESFHTPFYQTNNSEEQQSHDQFDDNNKNNNTVRHTQQLSTNNNTIPSTTSWSVENHPLSLSRYQREFHQLSLLATGSFGSVYHAIHKLEHKPYAVKRVTFSTTGYYANTLALVIREVRCLAQLDHKNCVRYYTSWLEPSWMTGGDQHTDDKIMGEDEDEPSDDDRIGGDGRTSRPKLLPHIERVVNEINNSTGEIPSMQRLESILYGDKDGNSDDGFEWDPVSSTQLQRHDELPSHRTATNQTSVYSYGSGVDDGDDDSDVSDWTQDMNGSNSSGFGFQRQGSLELVPADQHKANSAAAAPYKYQICLFIQMQLCHPTTLADWIKERNNNCTQFGAEERQVRARPAFEIFRQIVNGLAHVHSKGIIHRDLKPANIFASDDGTWMIGDFGLSKMMRDAQGGVDLDLHNNGIILPNGYSNGGAQHTAGVGTASYAAPEQITRKNYGPAVDIFSLGLILLELFSNFTSEHERAVAFHDCRYHGELAPWMARTYPDVSSLVLACTQKDWTQRPTASEILSASVFQEGLSGVEIYRAELKALNQELVKKDDLIQSQNDVIQSQNFELAEKDELIQQLMLRLENAGISSNCVVDEADSESSKH